ncbi:patatin-like phospholipase family protein [Hydromonas duriensis]|uniref:NTE family protein n=1 Tax=Hydromonas duriensis TaxID=1527608 RepID=A0A4R6Y731_9BURK|nr:patatin-like phospholipase family protein [Hydromonas duriensis]TDR30766.1 NTE family protein [Hydromonas duriensis]
MSLLNKRRVWPHLSALALALLSTYTQAAHADDAKRLKVGLVLGGGGARGAAHVGVIKKLEELRIPVDCISGTSMGGLVAGAFSTGMSSEQMSQALADADWRDMFNDSPNYAELTPRNKNISQTYIPASEAGIKNGHLKFPSAVLGGQKIKFFINQLVEADKAPQMIENQKLPLSLIATDIVTGQRVAYRNGDLATVMRATMSVPGLIAPVKYNGRTLVDGGLVDNVPIREVKEMCHPDVVIAVNVGSPLLKEEEIESSPLSVTAQTLNLLTEQNVTQSLAMLNRQQDVYIQPDLDGITAADFERNQETIKRGYAAANQAEAQLKKLSLTATQYSGWRAEVQNKPRPSPIIDKVEVVEGNAQDSINLTQQIKQKPNEPLNTTQLKNDLLYAYGDGRYSNMDYQLLSDHDKTTLRVLPTKKPWGPNYARAGLNFSWGTRETAAYNLRLGYQMTEINRLGGELLFSGQLGNTNRAVVNWYQPIDSRRRLFTDVSVGYSDQKVNVYQNGRAQSSYNTNLTEASAALGFNFNRYGVMKLGVVQRRPHASLDIGSESLQTSSTAQSAHGWYVSADFDRMNQLYFPTKGWLARASYFDMNDYSKVSAELQGAYSIKDFVFTGKLAYTGSPKGQLPLSDAAFLGGANNLAGLSNQQVIGDNLQYAGLRVERVLSKMPLGIRGDLRLGLSTEIGKMRTRYSETQGQGWIKSGSIYLGGETPVGPLYVGVSKATNNSPRVYLFIGTP